MKSSDPGILEIEITEEANAGDSLTVSYTAGSISAVDGSLLESFEKQAVYNYRNEGSGEQAVPGHVEAENYSSMFGIQLEPTTDIGGGNNVTEIDQNDWMEYDLLAVDSGNYQMDLRTASLSQAARIGLVVDGSVLSILDMPVTGGWQNWETVSTEIRLKQGLQKLKIFAFIGGFNLNWMEFTYATPIIEDAVIPGVYHFYQNYPNPFNPETTFTYVLPVRSRVILTIFDSQGCKVDSLLNDVQDNGIHEVKWNGSSFSSGIYMARLQAGKYQSCQKIVLLK